MTFGFPQGFDIDQVPATAFAKAAFDSIEFAYIDVSIRGGTRYAVHEFPHSPGAEIEKMGRRPYTIVFACTFHRIPKSELDRQYPDLYPTRLRQLRERFEKELTADLVVPNLGTIKATATSWNQTFNSNVPTGEQVTLEFIEDQDLGAFTDETSDYSPARMAEANDGLQALADFKRAKAQSVFQDINDAVTAVQGVFGQADAYSNLVAGKIAAVSQLCAFADGQLEELQNPENHLVLDALKDLWLATVKLGQNVTQTRAQLLSYNVPKVMSLNQIASTLGNSAEKLLELNSFDDALAVPAGTVVIYIAG